MARICREYGMSYPETLSLPLATFWSFNRQVDRLRAENDIRLLRVAVGAASEASFKQLSDSLQGEIGEVIRERKVFDRKKFEELQEKFKGIR